jgi:hypothetical protein
MAISQVCAHAPGASADPIYAAIKRHPRRGAAAAALDQEFTLRHVIGVAGDGIHGDCCDKGKPGACPGLLLVLGMGVPPALIPGSFEGAPRLLSSNPP